MTNYIFLTLLAISSSISAETNKTMEGFWLTSQSIVQVKNCDKSLCATIEHLFVDDDVDTGRCIDKT